MLGLIKCFNLLIRSLSCSLLSLKNDYDIFKRHFSYAFIQMTVQFLHWENQGEKKGGLQDALKVYNIAKLWTLNEGGVYVSYLMFLK